MVSTSDLFANRYTAFLDACVLVGVLKRNMLLTLAEAEFFRARWSPTVLDETQAGIEKILAEKQVVDAADFALKARVSMERAFVDASVSDYDAFLPAGSSLPDPRDIHVLAAAMKTQAQVIVTDNLKHFPSDILHRLNMDVRSADDFIADTIALDPARAVVALRQMRQRLRRPELDAKALLIRMEAVDLIATADILRTHEGSL